MNGGQKWPDVLWLVRHGQSAANVARAAAYAAGHLSIGLTDRDMDVPLSPLGRRQAQVLGRWFGALPVGEQPTVILTSPYERALQTTALLREEAAFASNEIIAGSDERLREREYGILEGLTTAGIGDRYPEQLAQRELFGKFYHRPPGGESWCDVILRLRSVIEMLTREYRGERVLIVCHSIVVLCFRYLLERLTEQQLLAIDRENEIANCSITSYAFDPALGRRGKLALQRFNVVAPLTESGETITDAPDQRPIP